jgi:hypothetical protein
MMVKHDEVYQAREDASRVAATNILTRLGAAVERLDRFVTEVPDDEHHIQSITIRFRYDYIGDVLLVARALCGKGKVVAFQTADSLQGAIQGFVNRLDNGTVEWREDKPYERGKGD